MNYSELAWTSIPQNLEDHIAQYCNRNNEHFDVFVDFAREVINELNEGKLVHEKVFFFGQTITLGEVLLRWDLNKFLDEQPPLVTGNLTIHEV